MIEKFDEVTRAAYVAAKSANRFRKRTDLNIDAAMHVEVIDSAAAIASKDAGRMRIIHHHNGAIFLGSVTQGRQRANVTIHGEDAIRDQ